MALMEDAHNTKTMMFCAKYQYAWGLLQSYAFFQIQGIPFLCF
jgi:hypothetical protein